MYRSARSTASSTRPALSELSATVLLYTSGTETISVAVFRLNDLGQLEVVAALSVVTIAVILVAAVGVQRLAGKGSVPGLEDIRAA